MKGGTSLGSSNVHLVGDTEEFKESHVLRFALKTKSKPLWEQQTVDGRCRSRGLGVVRGCDHCRPENESLRLIRRQQIELRDTLK